MKPCSLTQGCKGYFDLKATFAAHDDSMIDIIVECSECGRGLNYFITLDEMMELEN
jgi:hypothetical protein